MCGPNGCWNPATPWGGNASGRGTIKCPLGRIREDIAASGGEGVPILKFEELVLVAGELPYIGSGNGCFLASWVSLYGFSIAGGILLPENV